MRPEFFIGIDISKLTLDLAIVNTKGLLLGAYKVANTESSIEDILGVIVSNYKCTPSNTCFCAEDMGLFATYLNKAFASRKFRLCLESPLRIKKSIGIQRGKNDAIDAQRIARYACSNYDSLLFRSAPRPCMSDLRSLSTIRKRLLKTRKMLAQSRKTEEYYLHQDGALIGAKVYAGTLLAIQADIKAIEKRILEIISGDERLDRLVSIVTSVPSIGTVTAIQIIIATNEFEWICCPRKFASYCGVAPFQQKSGTSLNIRARVSSFANRELKSLLHMAAVGCAKKDRKDFLANYYQRKVSEGKKPMSVLNAVRNKLIHRVFSCVKSGSLFVDI